MRTDVIRQARAADYGAIAAVASDWWGRDMLAGLPRLFLDHFYTTSLIADNGGTMVGFVIGFYSPSKPDEAYIHYVAIHPDHRHRGLARRLYVEFLKNAARGGCTVVRAITSPTNEGSIGFHRHLGFDVSEPVPEYNGPGRDMVTFSRLVSEE